MTVPAVPPVPKDPDDFTVVGQPTTRIDARDIVTGRARYTQDLDGPGACPAWWPAHRRSGDGAHGRRRGGPGAAGRRRPSPASRPASPWWPSRSTRLSPPATPWSSTWRPGPSAGLSDADVSSRLAAANPPFVLPPLGSLTVERTFEFAFVPHAPLEVLNCVADVRADRAELWLPSKSPIVAAQSVAVTLGLPADRVTLHVVRGGGSFGRRLFFDPAIEAALVSRAVSRPVRLLWTRADDMHHGRLRPASHHRARATHLLGQVLSYEHRMASVALDGSHGLGELLTAVGAEALGGGGPGDVPAQPGRPLPLRRPDPVAAGGRSRVPDRELAVGVLRPGPHRRRGHGRRAGPHARAGTRVAFRRARLRSARLRAVLDKVAAAGPWGRPMAPGTAQGLGLHEEYKSVVAFLVELDARDRAHPRVTRAVAAVDVGRPINPRGLEAQMQGALVDALSVTLQAGVHIDGGAVRESSYTDFRYARMRDTPVEVEVHVMPPTGEPGGAGELGVPAASAAVANAWTRATGALPRRFPIVP